MNMCKPEVLQEGRAIIVGEDFSCCVPFGGQIKYKEGVLTYTAPQQIPPDGVYTSVVVKNGCIVGVGTADLSIANYAACTETTAACDVENSIAHTVSTVVMQGGTGIDIVGAGTTANPYIVSIIGGSDGTSVSSSGSLYLQAGNNGVLISGSGTASDPFTIQHKEVTQFDLINGMMFDRYGHLIQYSASSSSIGVNDIVAGYGIAVTRDSATKIVTVGLQKAANPINATIDFGKYSITFDEYNRVHKLTENTAIEGSGLTPSAYVFPYFDTETRTTKTVHILLASAAHLKVEVDGSIGTTTESDRLDVLLKIDNKAVQFGMNNATRSIFVSEAVYAAGTHSISVSRSDVTTTGRYFVTVTAVELV